MKTIVLEVPDDLAEMFGGSDEELAREIRLAAAIEWYRDELVSQGKAAEIAGLSRANFLLALGRVKVRRLPDHRGRTRAGGRAWSGSRIINASPLIFLTRLGLLDLLNEPGLTVMVPEAVLAELGHLDPDDPAAVAARSTGWIRIVPTPPIPEFLRTRRLGPGETSVLAEALAEIATATPDQDDVDVEVILDDGKARRLPKAWAFACREPWRSSSSARRRARSTRSGPCSNGSTPWGCAFPTKSCDV